MPGLLEKGCIERDVNAKMDLVSVVMTVRINTITRVETSEVASSKTFNKGSQRPRVAHHW